MLKFLTSIFIAFALVACGSETADEKPQAPDRKKQREEEARKLRELNKKY